MALQKNTLKQMQKELKQSRKLLKTTEKDKQKLDKAWQKKYDTLKKELTLNLQSVVSQAYNNGFNDALDELEQYSEEREKFLTNSEQEIEKIYAMRFNKKTSVKKKKISRQK
jgi:DNA polymerase I-like protein with 3'-5' exonuclease and polymerase domains